MHNFQVLRVVKTRQATYVVLNHLIEYVQNLEKAGILEEKEMLHLHDAVQVSCGVINYFMLIFYLMVHSAETYSWVVHLLIDSSNFQTDLKKLLRNPPLVKLPKISNIHPMLGALPSSVRELLSSGTKEMMKLRGLTLYKEGAKSKGIWLISNGVVKVLNSLGMKLTIQFLMVCTEDLKISVFPVGKQDDSKQAPFLSNFYAREHIGSL